MPTDYIIRPAVRSDIAGMQRLFRDTLLTICRRNYTTEEVADWASCGDSVAHWEELLSEHHYIVAHHRRDGIIGFSSMNASGYLHAMFVHKAWQGMGVCNCVAYRGREDGPSIRGKPHTCGGKYDRPSFFREAGFCNVTRTKSQSQSALLDQLCNGENFIVHN